MHGSHFQNHTKESDSNGRYKAISKDNFCSDNRSCIFASLDGSTLYTDRPCFQEREKRVNHYIGECFRFIQYFNVVFSRSGIDYMVMELGGYYEQSYFDGTFNKRCRNQIYCRRKFYGNRQIYSGSRQKI